ncbi:unnamed protein product, partial [Staurois parvus]
WGPRAIGDHGAPVSLPKLKKAYEKDDILNKIYIFFLLCAYIDKKIFILGYCGEGLAPGAD